MTSKENDIIQNVYEHIRKATNEAQKRYIEANTIILNKNFAMVNELYVPMTENSYSVFPRMLFGLKVEYAENLPYNANFALTKTDKSEYERVFEENEKLKKIIRDYCQIIDTNYGRLIRMYVEENEESNENDFKLLKEVLENDK